MRYLREADITVRNLGFASTIRSTLRKSASADAQGVFISHSHVDSTLAERLAGFVASFGVPVYVDILDVDIPSRTGVETAELLRAKIASLPKFIALVSEKALTSKWIPWELGFADGQRTKDLSEEPRVALLPVLRTASDWPGVEYMELYPQIKNEGDVTYIELPGGLRGPRFEEWLRSRTLAQLLAEYLDEP